MSSPLQIPSPIGAALPLVGRTYDEVKAMLVAYFRQRATRYQDWTEASLGVLLLETMAYAQSLGLFTLDTLGQEVYIPTIRDPRNMRLATKSIGYEMAGPAAASVDLRVVTASIELAEEVVIAAGTKITSDTGIIFEVLEEVTIVATDNEPHANWLVNGEQVSNTIYLSVTQGETLSVTLEGTGQIGQAFALPKSPVLDGSIIVEVDGVPWKDVESLVVGDLDDVNNTDIYESEVDELGRGILRFGDGTNGGIPVQGAEIVVTYRVGGGASTNVAALAISGPLVAVLDGQAGSIDVVNDTQATGGADAESVEHARYFAPRLLSTGGRAVSYGDYFAYANGYHVEGVGTIAKAGILADPTDGISNVVTVYVFGADSTGALVSPVSTSLREALRTFLQSRADTAVKVVVRDGHVVPVDIRLRIRVSPGFDPQVVSDEVRSRVLGIFLEEETKYANRLRGSRVTDVVQDVPGVEWVDVTVDPTWTNTSPYRPSDLVALPENAQVLYQATIANLVQTNVQAFDTSALRVPRATPWLGPGSNPNDIAVSFWIVDVSTAGVNGYAAPPIGTATNQYLQVIDQFDYTANGALAPAHLTLLLSKPINPGVVYKTSTAQGATVRLAHRRLLKLAAGRITANKQFRYHTISIIGGTGAGQERTIVDSFGPSFPISFMAECVAVDRDWTVFPDATSQYVILPNLGAPQDASLVAGNIDVQVVESTL